MAKDTSARAAAVEAAEAKVSLAEQISGKFGDGAAVGHADALLNRARQDLAEARAEQQKAQDGVTTWQCEVESWRIVADLVAHTIRKVASACADAASSVLG